MLHFLIVVDNSSITTEPVDSIEPVDDLLPLGPRSVVLSVLLGSHPPAMPVGALLDVTSLFGIADGTTRTALSRMVARGELDHDQGLYRLGERLLARQAEQDTGRRPPPREWDGTWWFAAVVTDRRTVNERRSFRARATGARFGELRPDLWLRPANIDVPLDLPDVVITRGPLVVGDDRGLARRLWDLDVLDRRARSLLDRLDRTARRLSGSPAEDGLPEAFTELATSLRFLRIEPQLPADLSPGTAATDLRARYDDVVASFQVELGAFLARRRAGRAQ
jgi:phenylacetic acid degradation operon negative regulatory protein